MEKTAKKQLILKIVGWALFIPIVSFMLFATIVQTAFSEKAVDIMGFRTCLIANTRSMEPELKYNDMVFVKKTDFESLSQGDIVTFSCRVRIDDEWKNVIITHQIIAVNRGENGVSYRTKGVNEAVGIDRAVMTADGSDGTNTYIGKVVFTSRFLGNLFAFIGSAPGLTSFIVNLAGIFVIGYIIKLEKTRLAFDPSAAAEDALKREEEQSGQQRTHKQGKGVRKSEAEAVKQKNKCVDEFGFSHLPKSKMDKSSGKINGVKIIGYKNIMMISPQSAKKKKKPDVYDVKDYEIIDE